MANLVPHADTIDELLVRRVTDRIYRRSVCKASAEILHRQVQQRMGSFVETVWAGGDIEDDDPCVELCPYVASFIDFVHVKYRSRSKMRTKEHYMMYFISELKRLDNLSFALAFENLPG